eukprot:scaffold2621_cov31-Tisochrysis_lutea.AAC.13
MASMDPRLDSRPSKSRPSWEPAEGTHAMRRKGPRCVWTTCRRDASLHRHTWICWATLPRDGSRAANADGSSSRVARERQARYSPSSEKARQHAPRQLNQESISHVHASHTNTSSQAGPEGALLATSRSCGCSTTVRTGPLPSTSWTASRRAWPQKWRCSPASGW